MTIVENDAAGVLASFTAIPKTACGLGVGETRREGAGELKGNELIYSCPQMSVS